MSSRSVLKRPTPYSGSKKSVPVDDSIFETLSTMHPDAAGIDIGSETHYVSVPPDRDEQPVRTFGCFTPDIEAMAKWLKKCGIRHIVMESTGVYWMPSYQILTAAGFDVKLVDARHTKNVPGRKTDVWDAKWLRKLHTFGLLQGCFLPPVEMNEMRAYWRHRANLVDSAAQQLQRMQKSMEMMNVQLHKVVSHIDGVTGMAIMRAIVAGERDPDNLVRHLQRGLKHSPETFKKALTGNYQPEHVFALRQAIASYDFIANQIDECESQLKVCMAKITDRGPIICSKSAPVAITADTTSDGSRPRTRKKEPNFELHAELIRIAGVDLAKIDSISTLTFQTVISELGPDLQSRFPTEDHFSSWLGVVPNNQITGGKVRSRRTRRVANRVTNALRMAAQSLHHSKSALGAFYRRLRSKLGAPKAIVATAHKLARLIWRMLTYGQDYVDIGQERYEKLTAERQLKALKRAAEALGCTILNKDTGEVYA